MVCAVYNSNPKKKEKQQQQKELRKTESIAGNPEKYATKMQCAMHVVHTGSQSHIPAPAPARTHPHTHSHAVGCTNFSVAYFVALEIFMAICQASDARQEEPAKCEAKCGANGIVALKCGQRRTKTTQERATTKEKYKERDREGQREGEKCG